MDKIKQIFTEISFQINTFYKQKPKVFYGAGGVLFALLLSVVILVIALMPPPPPSNIIIDAPNFDSVRLRWVSSQSADFYRIYRTQDKEQGYISIGETRNLHYLDENLDPGTIYYYSVVSVKNNKESRFDTEIQVVTGSISSPINVRVEQVGNNFITIAWDGFERAERFTVYRADGIDRPRIPVGNTVSQNFIDKELSPDTTYYYFITQTIDGEETAHSSQLIAATRSWTCGDEIYYDNDSYKTVRFDNLCWFQENLRYETLTGSWCYGNDERNCNIYGRMYNFKTAMNDSSEEGSQGICPSNWRIPTDEDFRNLERQTGMNRVEASYFEWRGEEEGVGDKLKIASACSQRGDDVCGNSNFQLTMGGQRSSAGAYRYITTHAFLWSSSFSEEQPIRRFFANDRSGVNRSTTSPENGLYIRCVRNI